MKYCTILFLAALILSACSKKKSVDIPEPGPGQHQKALEIVWKVQTDTSIFGSEGRQPLLWNDKLLWSNAPYGNGFEILLSDALDGTEYWRWDDFFQYPTLPYFNFHFISGDKYCFNNIQETHIIDLHTGNTFWQDLNRNAGAYISPVGEDLYGKLQDTDFMPSTCTLRRANINDPGWKNMLTLRAADHAGYSPAIFGPSLWQSSIGDSILVFQNRSWNFNTSDGRVDLYAYNLNRDTLHFRILDIEPSGNSNVLAPLIHGSRVFLLGLKNIHCVDMKTGNILWQKGFPGAGNHLLLSNLVVSEDKLIVKADNERIYAFNISNGNMIWATDDAGGSPSHMVRSGGAVYYTSDSNGKLYGVDISNGHIFLSEESPHKGLIDFPQASFHGGVAVSSTERLIYVHDHYYMMAIKIPGSL